MTRRLRMGLCLVSLWAGVGLPAADEAPPRRQMVLVASSEAVVSPLDSIRLRRLYLGMRVSQQGRVIVPLRNLSDPRLDALFVQAVMAMTARSYQRRLISGKFRAAHTMPLVYQDPNRLIQALRASPQAVSYMWADEARTIPGIRIIQRLWEGSLTG